MRTLIQAATVLRSVKILHVTSGGAVSGRYKVKDVLCLEKQRRCSDVIVYLSKAAEQAVKLTSRRETVG